MLALLVFHFTVVDTKEASHCFSSVLQSGGHGKLPGLQSITLWYMGADGTLHSIYVWTSAGVTTGLISSAMA